MKADIVTIFPDFFRGPLDYGITRRAQEMGLAAIQVHDLREFTHDRHRTVDDRPFGGGEGMVLKPEPLFECLDSLGIAPRENRISGRVKQSVVLLSAQGQRFTQRIAADLARLSAWFSSVVVMKAWTSESPTFLPIRNFLSVIMFSAAEK